ncbi:hypothetical protein [Burkholderia pseudomultivorans]|uniref:Uncharacterized protein n=1 Tax=Burkholderia pseudomultivorans TaxID=1207504 RepID=A0A132EYU8_9BURK|nr:hypothetical protein [Burkholderia pseudomultivorans]KWF63744.1 hypothetical protein WT57_21935 [Burkholderia pseudomultivorans]
MPVVLPISPRQRSDEPRPPRAIVWLALFVVVMFAGVAGTLLTWPKAEPTGTPWFWVQLFALPALGWALAFGLRLHYYDEEVVRQEAEDEVLREDRAKAIRFASEPLAVVGLSYLCGAGPEDVAKKIAQGETALAAKTSQDGKSGKRHTSLPLVDNEDGMGRYGSCFESLLTRVGPAIMALPQDVALDVRLHLPDDERRELRLQAWHQCWSKSELRPAPTTLIPVGQGLMALDEWLDIKGGPSLERFVLFVSAQLHDVPPDNSAEAAVALLLGWAPLAERRGIRPLAMMHRPLAVETGLLDDAIQLALLWGKTTPAQVTDLWQAAMLGEDKGVILQKASDTKLAVSQTTELAGIRDIDTALGNPGVCAGWLAAALAIEHAEQTGAPQILVWRERNLHLAVVQPAAVSRQQTELKA